MRLVPSEHPCQDADQQKHSASAHEGDRDGYVPANVLTRARTSQVAHNRDFRSGEIEEGYPEQPQDEYATPDGNHGPMMPVPTDASPISGQVVP